MVVFPAGYAVLSIPPLPSGPDTKERESCRHDSAEMLVWRKYEMGYRPHSDPDIAVKLAFGVIKHQRGR